MAINQSFLNLLILEMIPGLQAPFGPISRLMVVKSTLMGHGSFEISSSNL
jgi:hypothetical protein